MFFDEPSANLIIGHPKLVFIFSFMVVIETGFGGNGTTPSPTSSTCHSNAFWCPGKGRPAGRCVEFYRRCDGSDDCSDARDESNCTCYTPKFACRRRQSQIVDAVQLCDGRRDCDDGSDEDVCKMSSIYETAASTELIPIDDEDAEVSGSGLEDDGSRRSNETVQSFDDAQNITVKEGGTVSLKCRQQYAQDESALWRYQQPLKNDSEAVCTGDDRQFIISRPKLVDYNLVIHRTEPRNAGLYTCVTWMKTLAIQVGYMPSVVQRYRFRLNVLMRNGCLVTADTDINESMARCGEYFSTDDDDDDKRRLSFGVVIGLAVGLSVAFTVLTAAVIIVCCRKRSPARRLERQSQPNGGLSNESRYESVQMSCISPTSRTYESALSHRRNFETSGIYDSIEDVQCVQPASNRQYNINGGEQVGCRQADRIESGHEAHAGESNGYLSRLNQSRDRLGPNQDGGRLKCDNVGYDVNTCAHAPMTVAQTDSNSLPVYDGVVSQPHSFTFYDYI